MIERDYYFLLRRKKGIRLQEVAEYVGCSPATISLMENGKLVKPDRTKELKYQEFIDER